MARKPRAGALHSAIPGTLFPAATTDFGYLMKLLMPTVFAPVPIHQCEVFSVCVRACACVCVRVYLLEWSKASTGTRRPKRFNWVNEQPQSSPIFSSIPFPVAVSASNSVSAQSPSQSRFIFGIYYLSFDIILLIYLFSSTQLKNSPTRRSHYRSPSLGSRRTPFIAPTLE